jgi:outer membrane receptor protein involved in Fe transport
VRRSGRRRETAIALWTWGLLAVLSTSAEAEGPAGAPTGNSAISTESASQDAAPVNSAAASETMRAYVVTESAYKAYLLPSEIRLLELFQLMNLNYDYGSFDTRMSGSFVATPLRIPQHPKNSAFTAYVFSGKELRNGPSVTIDGALSSEPEFSISGRDNAFSPQENDSGIALRGVGARGTGARVLLDGVPFNDPFGGWVPWNEAPYEGLARAEVVLGGGGTAWGNGALGGVVQLFTTPASGELVTKPGVLFGGGPQDPTLTKQVVEGSGQIAATFGDFDTRSVEFVADQPTSTGVLQILGNVFSTDGFPVVSLGQRGPIDSAAWNRHNWFDARWRMLLGKKLVLTATIRGYEERHGDGTPYQQGSSEGKFASVSIAGHPSSGFAWDAVAYVQDEGAATTFSSVNPARTAETPVINQYAQPATAFGASWSGEWWQPDGSSSSAGADFRYIRGETREDMAFSDRAYATGLIAGGDQGDFGTYFLRDQRISSTFRVVLGARIDAWNEAGGHQSETSLITGSTLGDDRFATDSGTEFCPSLGLAWRPTTNWRIHANAQQAFGRPTLSELYRPFGQASIVTEANPLLRTEHNTSCEVGAEYVFHLEPTGRQSNSDLLAPPHWPSPGTLTFGATAFSDELRDVIGNLTAYPNSGAFPGFGTLPDGYVGQQWINLDRSHIQGVTLSARWSPGAAFSIDAKVLFNEATVDRVDAAPELARRQLAGVPRRSAAVSATWHFSDKIALKTRMRVLGSRFEDDENELRLDATVVVDLEASYALTKRSELFVTAENLTDARVEVSRSADGLVYVGEPRLILGGIRFSW